MKTHCTSISHTCLLLALIAISISGFSQGIILSEIGDSYPHNETTFGGIIEIKNSGTTAIDVTGYSIEDPSTGYRLADSRTFLSYDTVGCGEDMILAPNEVMSIFRFLNKNSQTINLYDASDHLISSVTWGDSPHFIKASKAGLWTNGPTPIVPDGRSIVNIGSGTSWMDWVVSEERTPCEVVNNTKQQSRKNVGIYKAVAAKMNRSKIKGFASRDTVVMLKRKSNAFIEWEITMPEEGVYDAFLNYCKVGEDPNIDKGVLLVNGKTHSKLDFEYYSLPEKNIKHKKLFFNEFSKVYLSKGLNTIRFTTTEERTKNELWIRHFGIVANTETNSENIEALPQPLTEMPSGYTHTQANDASDGWISKFSLGSIDHNSGSSVYSDFSQFSTELVLGKIYQYTLTPAWSGTIYKEGYAIWIDYNRDGSFDGKEKVVAVAPSRMETISGSFTIPRDAKEGVTKIRVAMEYNAVPGLSSNRFVDGEYEDYVGKIIVSSKTQTAIAKVREAVSIYPNPVVHDVLNITCSSAIDRVEFFSMQGKLALAVKNSKTIRLASLNTGNYIVKIHDTDGNSHTKQISVE